MVSRSPNPAPPPDQAPISLATALAQRLAHLAHSHLTRELRRVTQPHGVSLDSHGNRFVQFASNDYLGLAQHPLVIQAARDGAATFGAGSTASRLICGSLEPHHALEEALAEFKGTEAALTFASGYTTALGTIPALVGPGDTVILDRLAHACLVDGARLSGAQLRVFRHNDPADLERVLRSEQSRRTRHSTTLTSRARPAATLVITESVFSMDGDLAPLQALADVKDAAGAWLLVDEAHATGLLGPRRAGWIEALGVRDRVEVTLGTLGKALGVAGGFIAGSRLLHDVLIHDARSFLFSTAPPPANATAALAALRLVQSPEGAARVEQLGRNVHHLHAGLTRQGWELPPPASPILPLRIGDEAEALTLASALRAHGFLVPAIRHPTVARGQARLRLTLSALHQPEHLDAFLDTLARLRPDPRPTPTRNS